MRTFVLRLALNALALLVIANVVPGIHVEPLFALVAGEKEWRGHEDARLHGVRLYHTVARALDELGRRFNLGPVPARDETPY